ncbi:uncharacterized protein LOC125472443 [Pyrus x bretschneideri]|uniref:uncharacterized protein LOC125472443 n=1 Tax=Pyrus x bretschneideri TaxID=225117 RepID=UPI00202F0E59|nr:uncharacterized protein LOC125472443 [Pyrus x bretschneideri]
MAFHTRSNSFPSRPHLIAQEVDELLCRLRSSEATSTSSSSITRKLNGLQDCVDWLLQLPSLSKPWPKSRTKWTNELLDGSIRLTRGGESGALTSEANKSLSSRKIVKEAIQKALKNLKGIENRSTYSALNKDQEAIVIVSKLRDVEAVTAMVLESVLSFISGPKSKPSSWSLVSKMMHQNKVASDEET